MSVLVLCEHSESGVSEDTLSAVAAVRTLGMPADLLIASPTQTALEQAKKVDGVRKVLRVVLDDATLAEPLADCLVAVAGNYNLIVAAATSHGKNVMPRVAALADLAQISDVTAILGPKTFERPIYAGNAYETLQLRGDRAVVTIRASAFSPVSLSEAQAPVEDLPVPTAWTLSRTIDRQANQTDRPDLSGAKVVVSGGRALGSKENFESLLLPLADSLGAAVGASRAAVDAGFAANDLQVGQTGKIVAPQVYLAIGISGALQHLAGMKDSRKIFAINKDAEAPILAISDYYMVGDLFSILPELQAALADGRQTG